MNEINYFSCSNQKSHSIYKSYEFNASLYNFFRAIAVLKRWVDRYWYDFLDSKNRKALDKAVRMIGKLNTEAKEDREFEEGYAEDFRRLSGLLAMAIERKARTYKPPVEIARLEMVKGRPEFLMLDSKELANALTLIEYERFRSVRSLEFVLQLWGTKGDPDTEKELTNMNAMVSGFNQISYWAATEICTQPELKNRVKVIESFIRVAKVRIYIQHNSYNNKSSFCIHIHIFSLFFVLRLSLFSLC